MTDQLNLFENSYLTKVEADAYLKASARAAAAWALLESDAKRRALISAFRQIERFVYEGSPTGVQYANSAVVDSGGAGYLVGDVVTLNGGLGVAAQYTVTTAPAGVVTAVTVVDGERGGYTTLPGFGSDLFPLEKLLAYYKFNEPGAGATALDAHTGGFAIAEVNSGTPSTAVTGKIGAARFVNRGGATNNHFPRANTGAGDPLQLFQYPNGFSASAWVNRDTTLATTIFTILAQRASGATSWALQYNTNNDRPEALVANTDPATFVAVGTAAIPTGLGPLVMLTMVYDKATKIVSLYRDGVLDAVSPPLTGLENTTTAPFTIFGEATLGLYWDGHGDEMSIFKEPLTAAEVLALYNTDQALAYPNNPVFATGGTGAGLTLLPVYKTQTATFPRTGILDRFGAALSEFIPPADIEAAQAELAFEISQDTTVEASASTGSNQKRLKAGSVELEFFRPTDGTRLPTVVQELINPFLGSLQGASSGSASFGTDACSEFDSADTLTRNQGYP